ncbi:MAG: histidine phosphatase family protein [Trueperaceae bacterium]
MSDSTNDAVRELWWIRHGRTDWNAAERIQGVTDVPLNDDGRAQARALAERLTGQRFDGAFTSDLERAHETAVTALPSARVVPDARLRELAYGLLEGARWSEFTEAQAEAARIWREDPVNRRLPDGDSYGESYADLTERVQAFLSELPARGRFAAFAHGGTIRSALYALLGNPNGGAWRVAIDNTGITRIRFDARGAVIVTINDHAHLAALPTRAA